MVSFAGMDPMRFLYTDDPLEASVMHAVAGKFVKARDDFAEMDANRIANAVGRMLGAK